MSKYKVGDRVEFCWVPPGHPKPIGVVVEVGDNIRVRWETGWPGTHTFFTHGNSSLNIIGRVDSPQQPEPHSATAASLRERLARHFGLALDAPDAVVFSSACRAWDHFDEAYAGARVSIAAAREARDSVIRRANDLADELGNLTHEVAKLQADNTELLAENARLRRNKGE